MQREYQRALGPTASLPTSFSDPTIPRGDNSNGNNNDNNNEDEIDGELLGSTGAQVIQVLRMIYNRLLVETKMKQNNNVRVLAKAMNTNDVQVCLLLLSLPVYIFYEYNFWKICRIIIIHPLILTCR